MTSTQRQFRSEPRSGKSKILLLLVLVAAYLIVPAPASAQTATIFNYTGNRLSNGGFITASVTLPCSLPCAPGKYGGAWILALSLSYGSVTLSWPPGNGAPTDPWI